MILFKLQVRGPRESNVRGFVKDEHQVFIAVCCHPCQAVRRCGERLDAGQALTRPVKEGPCMPGLSMSS